MLQEELHNLEMYDRATIKVNGRELEGSYVRGPIISYEEYLFELDSDVLGWTDSTEQPSKTKIDELGYEQQYGGHEARFWWVVPKDILSIHKNETDKKELKEGDYVEVVVEHEDWINNEKLPNYTGMVGVVDKIKPDFNIDLDFPINVVFIDLVDVDDFGHKYQFTYDEITRISKEEYDEKRKKIIKEQALTNLTEQAQELDMGYNDESQSEGHTTTEKRVLNVLEGIHIAIEENGLKNNSDSFQWYSQEGKQRLKLEFEYQEG